MFVVCMYVHIIIMVVAHFCSGSMPTSAQEEKQWYKNFIELFQSLNTSIAPLSHCKNKMITLTQLGLSQLQL